VLLASAVTGLADYALKLEAAAHVAKGPALVRFFGLFYAGAGVVSLLLQIVVSKPAVARLGLGGAVAAHPAVVAVSAALGFFIPGPWRGVLPRGSDYCVRSSLFRAGYELLYTPLPAATKRSMKPVIDVGWDSVGRGAAAAVALALGLLPPAWTFAAVNAAALAVALVELGVARRLQAGYVEALEGGLVRSAADLETAAERSLTDFTIAESVVGLDPASVRRALGARAARRTAAAAPAAPAIDDPVVAAIADLRSADVSRIRATLAALPRDPLVVGALVPLLARRDVLRPVLEAIESFGTRATAQLVDALLDAGTPDAVRRRLPAALRRCPSTLGRDGLLEALRRPGLDLRLRCGRALLSLTERHPELAIPRETALAAVDRALRDWGERSRLREHVLDLLVLGLEREPAEIAARALDCDDAHLRGTALEYYETTLPRALFAAVAPLLEPARGAVARAPAEAAGRRPPATDARGELLKAGATMTLSLADIEQRLAEAEADS